MQSYQKPLDYPFNITVVAGKEITDTRQKITNRIIVDCHSLPKNVKHLLNLHSWLTAIDPQLEAYCRHDILCVNGVDCVNGSLTGSLNGCPWGGTGSGLPLSDSIKMAVLKDTEWIHVLTENKLVFRPPFVHGFILWTTISNIEYVKIKKWWDSKHMWACLSSKFETHWELTKILKIKKFSLESSLLKVC